MKQNKYIKSVCSNPVRRSAANSSFNIMRFIRNRKTFLVCLTTVLCYTLGFIPMTACLIWNMAEKNGLPLKYFWLSHLANILATAGSHAVNSSYIRNTGQKIVPILENLPQEEAKITGKLNSNSCILSSEGNSRLREIHNFSSSPISKRVHAS